MIAVKTRLTGILRDLGPLRVLLVLCAIVAIVSVPEPGTPSEYSGWALVPTVLIPVMAPMVFMVLVLDALMGRVFSADSDAADKRRLRLIVRIDLLLALGIVLAWLPFFLALRG